MTMLSAFSGLLRKLAALALLVAVLAAPVLLLGWPALARHQQSADDVAAGLAQLGTLQAAIERERSVAGGAAVTPAPEKIFFEAESEAALLAGLQARLVEIAAAEKVQLLSSSQLPVREDGDANAMGVRVTLRSDLVTVQHLLHAVESARPFMFVEVADLRSDGLAEAAPVGTAQVIDATLDVFGVAAPAGLGKGVQP